MHRRKATVAAAALFAIGAAFAAEPTSLRADWSAGAALPELPWQPGTHGVMSAHDSDQMLLSAPPQ